MKFSLLNRKLHRWGAIVGALPLLLVVGTGILLLLKKDLAWIQPPTKRGAATAPTLGLDELLAAATTASEAGIQGWEDVDRVDVRPGRGLAKFQSRTSWEVQVDTATAEVLSVAYRRSDLIESLHDGSFFHERAKLAVFLPHGILLLALWASGLWLFFLPYAARRRRARS
ncbi:MAG: PepSY-associated TM helix domain-containing protein [Planctomycetota bacterium]